MSRVLGRFERFLAESGFDRAPWLGVAFGAGIAAWFTLESVDSWLFLLGVSFGASVAAFGLAFRNPDIPYLNQSFVLVPLMFALGIVLVWSKSSLVGQEPIEGARVERLSGTVLERIERPAESRVRLVLATRDSHTGEAIRIRVNLDEAGDDPDIRPGARIAFQARLMPPAPPMLPGGYNFARTAWFEGLAATGSVLGNVEIEQASDKGGDTAQIQARLSQHVRTHVGGAAGAIAATLASGDRGAIPEADAQAMRDSGLAHLLSISGLHVSAVIAIAYVLAIRLLAFWPWLALRVRLPILASAIGASAGLGYTMLTGAQVPTVRSCVAALLVLGALALGREALSTRMLAVAAFVVLMLWPESIVGPSFQMSFAAVLAIIALNTSEPVKRFLGPRDEGWFTRGGRYLLMLFVTGLVIELALMPIALFHFHRAGIYGAFANVIAIPLTTIVVMPLIGLALAFDLVGLGAPAWWLVERAISALLSLAHFISSREGAVTTLPSIGEWRFALFVGGGIWLALWNSRIRYLGLLAAGAGAISLAALDPPDILVSGDGRQIGIPADDGASLFVLRDTRSDYVRDNFTELAGMRGRFRTFAEWEGARCTPDFCSVKVTRGTKDWHILVARSHDRVPERALAAACDKSDIVIADRWLPRSCRPRWLKADRDYLSQTGGLAIDLERQKITSVADTQGEHGWWRGRPGS